MTRPLVEVAFGYSLTQLSPVMTDISQYVDLAREISITRGTQNELSETQPGSCQITLDNSDGRFTPDRSSGAYYPNVKMAAPIRVSVATFTPPSGTAPYPIAMLSDDFDDNRVDTAKWPDNYGNPVEVGGRARVPAVAGVYAGYKSAASWSVAGSQVTVRVPTIPAAGGGSDVWAAVWANSTTDGTRIGFQISPVTGTLRCESAVGYFDAGATVLTYAPYSHSWLRLREASGTLYWETSPDGYSWTVRRTLATPAWVTSQAVTLSLEAYRDAGASDFAEYDLLGATVHPRFFGLVNEWPVEWKGLMSTATINCSDLFTWASVNKQLQPMLVQEVLLDRPTVYFPLTEPSDSVSAGDLAGTQGVGSLAATQAGAGGTLEFGAGTGPAGAGGAAAPVFTPASTSAGKYLSADLGQSFVDANLNFRVRGECWFSTSTDGRVLWALASADASVKLIVSLESGTGKLKVEYQSDGSALASVVAATPNLADGALHYVLFNQFADQVTVDGTTYTATTIASSDLRLLTVGGYASTRLWSGTIAHLALYIRSVTTAELTPHYTTGTTEHIGEDADVRLARLGSYAGLGVTVQGSTFDPVASQSALGSSALQHMREIETTESGKLLTTRNAGPLLFQSRDLRYNPIPAITLDYADLETDDVRYAYDDQKMVNTVTASRPGGATQRVLNQASVDSYGEKSKDLQLLKTTDNASLDAANWLVSRYAQPVAEVRQVPVEAYSMPLATYRALLSADVSTVLGINGLPSQAPTSTTSVFVEGYTERIGLSKHRIDFHTSRADTDTVWILDDPVYSVLGSTTRLAY